MRNHLNLGCGKQNLNVKKAKKGSDLLIIYVSSVIERVCTKPLIILRSSFKHMKKLDNHFVVLWAAIMMYVS